MIRFAPPPPRPAVADPALKRPAPFNDDPRAAGVLGLDRNECVDPELNALVAGIVAGLPERTAALYPTPGPLYRRLAAELGVAADRLLLTLGSDGAIATVFQAYVEPGDAVVLTRPTYGMYDVYAAIAGARVHHVDYRLEEGVAVLGADEIAAAVRRVRPKLVGLANPASPTGGAFAPAEMRMLIEAAGEAGALILVDEAYFPFHAGTVLPWIEEHGHLAVARTFSKAYGMAGLRLGYLAAAPAVSGFLHKVRPPFEGDGVAIQVALRLLDEGAAVAASIARMKRGRAYFAREMKALDVHVAEAACNFVHVDFGDAREKVAAALAPVCRYRIYPGSILEGQFRFTATTEENFRPVVAAIRAAVV